MAEPHARVLEHLNSSKISFDVRDHAAMSLQIETPADFAAALGYPIGRIMKTLLCRSRSVGTYVAVVCPIDVRVDFKHVAAQLNCGRLETASPEQLAETTQYPQRGVSPLGLDSHIAVVIARQALEYETVLIGGGSVGVEIEIAPAELVRIAHAVPVDFNPSN